MTTEEKARILEKQGFTHRKLLRLRPDAAILRLVVRNARTGALGSLSAPVR